MTLKEIVAKLTGHETAIADLKANKEKQNEAAITFLATEVGQLKTGAVAELAQAQSDLTTAKASVASLTTDKNTANIAAEKAQGDVNAVGGALKAACEELKLELKADATSLDMVFALKGGVSSTLAKLNISARDIPTPKPTAGPADNKAVLTGRDRMLAATKFEGQTKTA